MLRRLVLATIVFAGSAGAQVAASDSAAPQAGQSGGGFIPKPQ